MLELTFLLLAIAAFVALVDWKKGLTLCVVVGMMQDPLRKLVVGQPMYFVVLVGVVFGAALVGAYFSRERLALASIPGWREQLRVPFMLFILLVLLQGAHSFARFGSPVVTGIGLLVWLAPVAALTFSYRLAVNRGLSWIRSWMVLYCVVAILFLSGVYLEYAGVNWAVLGEVGEGIKIFDVGTILKANAGFFRSSEIAAWHTSTAACFLFLLFGGKRITATRLIVGLALVGMLLGLGILTGRRKMLVEVAIFVITYLGLVFSYQRGQGRQALLIVFVGLVALAGAADAVGPDEDYLDYRSRPYVQRELDQYQIYALRGQSVVEDIPTRFMNLGLAPVRWAVDSLGWFGSGLGTGSQGTGGANETGRNIGAAEGGLGKITVELGVPGLLVLAWLAVSLLRHVHRLLRTTARISPVHMRMASGFVAFLVAKSSSFAVAAQAYSDLFILLILGSILGFLLATPVLIQRDVENERRRQHAITLRSRRPAFSL